MGFEFKWVVYAALVVVALIALLIIANIVLNMRAGLRSQKGGLLVPPDDVFPVYDATAIQIAGARLTELGFSEVARYRQDAMAAAMVKLPHYIAVYFESTHSTFATVQRNLNLQDHIPYALVFHNLCPTSESSKHQSSVNRTVYLFFFSHVGFEVQDPYANSLDAHWSFHRSRLQEAARVDGSPQWIVDPARAVNLLLTASPATQADAFQRGVIRKRGEYFYPNFLPALRLAWSIVFKPRKMAQPYTLSASEVAAQAEVERRASTEREAGRGDDTGYLHFQAESQKRGPEKSRLQKIYWFVLLTIVTGLSFGLAFNNWAFVPALLAVILIHELGHFLAMRICGYQNVEVFFVPFLGGATTGRKDDASPMQQLFVYLAGPLPGLIIGGVLLLFILNGLWSASPSLRSIASEFCWMSVIINAINLLPITPLDGGRIVEIFVFGRMPRFKVIFSFVCVGVIMFYAFWSESVIAGVFAVMLALILPLQWRLAQVVMEVRRNNPPPLSESVAGAAVYRALMASNFAKVATQTKHAIYKQVLSAVRIRPPGWIATLIGLMVYGSVLISPLVAYFIWQPNLLYMSMIAPPGNWASTRTAVDFERKEHALLAAAETTAQALAASAVSGDEIIEALKAADADENIYLARAIAAAAAPRTELLKDSAAHAHVLLTTAKHGQKNSSTLNPTDEVALTLINYRQAALWMAGLPLSVLMQRENQMLSGEIARDIAMQLQYGSEAQKSEAIISYGKAIDYFTYAEAYKDALSCEIEIAQIHFMQQNFEQSLATLRAVEQKAMSLGKASDIVHSAQMALVNVLMSQKLPAEAMLVLERSRRALVFGDLINQKELEEASALVSVQLKQPAQALKAIEEYYAILDTLSAEISVHPSEYSWLRSLFTPKPLPSEARVPAMMLLRISIYRELGQEQMVEKLTTELNKNVPAKRRALLLAQWKQSFTDTNWYSWRIQMQQKAAQETWK
jgi:Zn-dependent protease